MGYQSPAHRGVLPGDGPLQLRRNLEPEHPLVHVVEFGHILENRLLYPPLLVDFFDLRLLPSQRLGRGSQFLLCFFSADQIVFLLLLLPLGYFCSDCAVEFYFLLLAALDLPSVEPTGLGDLYAFRELFFLGEQLLIRAFDYFLALPQTHEHALFWSRLMRTIYRVLWAGIL